MDNTINDTSIKSCIICYNMIPNGNLCITGCQHIYCNKCLSTWFNRGNSDCPMCRRDITTYSRAGNNYRVIKINDTREISIPIENDTVNNTINERNNSRSLNKDVLRIYLFINSIYLLYLQYNILLCNP